jgi:hypothetical protein
MNRAEVVDYVRQRAPAYGLDAAAVLSVAQGEGLGTNPNGAATHDPARGAPQAFAVGPWQLNSAGALPRSIGVLGGAAAQSWAWSTTGVDYALRQMSGVARGLSGGSAIRNLIEEFERPREDLRPGAIKNAIAAYTNWLQIVGQPASKPTTSVPSEGGVTAGAEPGTEPGGNRIVPTPAQPDTSGSWWHVLVAIGLVLGAVVLFFGGVMLLAASNKTVQQTAARAAAVAE